MLMGTKEVAKYLKNLFVIFDLPKETVSDRGTAFTSTDFDTFISTLKDKHRKVAVAAP